MSLAFLDFCSVFVPFVCLNNTFCVSTKTKSRVLLCIPNPQRECFIRLLRANEAILMSFVSRFSVTKCANSYVG